MKNKTLPSIRISEKTNDKIASAVKKYNQTSLSKLSIQEFRRISYEVFAQKILNNNLEDIEIS